MTDITAVLAVTSCLRSKRFMHRKVRFMARQCCIIARKCTQCYIIARSAPPAPYARIAQAKSYSLTNHFSFNRHAISLVLVVFWLYTALRSSFFAQLGISSNFPRNKIALARIARAKSYSLTNHFSFNRHAISLAFVVFWLHPHVDCFLVRIIQRFTIFSVQLNNTTSGPAMLAIIYFLLS